MRVLSKEFEQRLDEACWLVRNGLGGAWLTFGETDFPDDRGVAFRNKLFGFMRGFISELHLDDIPNDIWPSKNIPLLEKLSVHQLVQVIGTLHLYAITLDYIWGRRSLEEFHKSLDWVTNTYRFAGSTSSDWFDLARDHAATFHSREGADKMYREIATIIGADPMDQRNWNAWSGLAIVILESKPLDAVAYAASCEEYFRR